MKKIICGLLAILLMLSLVITPVCAQINKSVHLYEDKFIEYELGDYFRLHYYNEIYYHKDEEDNIDWALLYAYTGPAAESRGSLQIGDRIIVVNVLCSPFTYKYGIYDVKADKFVAIDEFIDYTNYKDLKEYVYANLGVLAGDADKDDELSIIDATMIQRCVAQMCTHKEEIWINDYCDLDKDYDITVMDATAVQLKIAKLD